MPAQALTDFPDRLSPMLVKELRQGLRTRTFMVVFLLLQVFTALILLSASIASSYDEVGITISRIIFIFLSMAVLLVQPLRGINAVHSEIKGRTIDLMVLSRLSAWRIVLGKWVAIVSQSALLLTAIVPYLVLRYFFGRMNLFGELSLLGAVFLLSMLLTAITVGLSVSPSVLVRTVLPLIGAAFLFFAIPSLCLSPGFEYFIDFLTFTEPEAKYVVPLFVAMAFYLGWTALGFAAGVIAPPAKNHATLRRIVALVVASGSAVFCALALPRYTGWAIVPFMACLTPVIAIALTEPDMLVPIVCKPFVRFGAAGRAAGRFLYPGWPSGVFFVGLLAPLFAFCVHRADLDPEAAVTMSAWFGSLLFPAACIIPFSRRIGNLFTAYLFIFIGGAVFAAVLAILTSAMNSESVLWLFVWLPPAHPVLAAQNSIGGDDLVFTASMLCDIVLYGILVVFSFARQRNIAETEKEALAIVETRNPAPEA